jgi:hypothetical protein
MFNDRAGFSHRLARVRQPDWFLSKRDFDDRARRPLRFFALTPYTDQTDTDSA